MTIDEFFAHVQEHGFNGYSPGPKDILGDSWARKIGEGNGSTANWPACGQGSLLPRQLSGHLVSKLRQRLSAWHVNCC